MLELTRTVRFCLNGPGAPSPPPRHNGYSAWPAMRGLGRFYQLRVTCRGRADPVTGYFLDIRHIDAAVRDHVLPYLEKLLATERASARIGLGSVLSRALRLLQKPLHHTVVAIQLDLSPFFSVTLRENDMRHLIFRQQYEFAAAHRLHVPEMTDAENRRIFGKCHNPAGHGHNYRVEVAVRSVCNHRGQTLAVEELDALVDEAVIQKLDHKHLNVDVPEFARLNPSVENITVLVYAWLQPALRKIKARLEEVRVWETEKTVCTYRGE